jgi:TatD DNase family protein
VITSELVDIGLNLTNKRFDTDRSAVLQRARDTGIGHCIITGTSLKGSQHAVALCQELNSCFPGMLSATAGVHPHDADSVDDAVIHQLHHLIATNRSWIVAVGETGLDFNRNFSAREAQISALEKHIELAISCGLPLFLHERDAHTTQFEVLQGHSNNLPIGVIHCFTGDKSALRNYLDLGYYIGITGWVCDERRGEELQDLIRYIPLERLLIETDAPYLLPRTMRPKLRDGRNEPAFLPLVLEAVATYSDRSKEDIARYSAQNARHLFQLDNLPGAGALADQKE